MIDRRWEQKIKDGSKSCCSHLHSERSERAPLSQASDASGRPSEAVVHRSFMRAVRIGPAAALAVFALMGVAGQARPETLNALEKTYAQITTVEAHFHQTILIKALKRERETEGDFYYKRSKGFLWKYTAPKEKIFLYDGAAMWQAEGDAPFATRQRIDRDRMEGSFLDLVDDATRLDTFFTVIRSSRQGETDVLDLAPKKEGTLKSARIWIDGRNLITRLEIDEITGNVNVIDFSKAAVNQPLSDSLFIFKPGNRDIRESGQQE